MMQAVHSFPDSIPHMAMASKEVAMRPKHRSMSHPPSLPCMHACTHTNRYGLGSIYFRQEKYELAEYHFARALHINDQSSVRCVILFSSPRRRGLVSSGGREGVSPAADRSSPLASLLVSTVRWCVCAIDTTGAAVLPGHGAARHGQVGRGPRHAPAGLPHGAAQPAGVYRQTEGVDRAKPGRHASPLHRWMDGWTDEGRKWEGREEWRVHNPCVAK